MRGDHDVKSGSFPSDQQELFSDSPVQPRSGITAEKMRQQRNARRALSNTLSYVAGLRATDESVPGPLRDVQTVRYILR